MVVYGWRNFDGAHSRMDDETVFLESESERYNNYGAKNILSF